MISARWTALRTRNGGSQQFHGPDLHGNGKSYGRYLYAIRHVFGQAFKMWSRETVVDEDYTMVCVWQFLKSQKEQYTTLASCVSSRARTCSPPTISTERAGPRVGDSSGREGWPPGPGIITMPGIPRARNGIEPERNQDVDPRLTIYSGLSANERARLDSLVTRRRVEAGASPVPPAHPGAIGTYAGGGHDDDGNPPRRAAARSWRSCIPAT